MIRENNMAELRIDRETMRAYARNAIEDLCQDPKYVTILREIAELEKRQMEIRDEGVTDPHEMVKMGGYDPRFGWEISKNPQKHDLHLPHTTWREVNEILAKGLIEDGYQSNSHHHYYWNGISPRSKYDDTIITPSEVLEVLDEIEKPEQKGIEKTKEWGFFQGIPDDLFDVVVGYSDIKTLFKKAIQSEKHIHILLVGKPSTAKSLFLMELERIGGILILGGTSSKVGIRDILFQKPPLLLIDEIDKINSSNDLSALLTWMEDGRVIMTKHRTYRQESIDKCMVVGACNRTDKLPEELLSRFVKIHLKEYTLEEFIEVASNVLIRREGADRETSIYIAGTLAKHGYRDVRDPIKMYRLAKTEKEVDQMIKIWEKYGVKSVM